MNIKAFYNEARSICFNTDKKIEGANKTYNNYAINQFLKSNISDCFCLQNLILLIQNFISFLFKIISDQSEAEFWSRFFLLKPLL